MKTEKQIIVGTGVLVVTPERPIRIGRDRLESLRAGTVGSAIDRTIVDAVGEHAGDIEVMIFRGASPDGLSGWAFADDLGRAECEELGRLMIRSQIPMYRHLAAEGVILSLKVDWGPREADAFQGGTQIAIDELEALLEVGGDEARAMLNLDLWLMRHFSTWLLASFDECCRSFLPRTMPRIEQRGVAVRRLLDAVPSWRLSDPLACA